MKSTIVAALTCGLVASFANAETCVTQEEEIHALALNIYHEARGEDPDAQQMVGEVVLNRVMSENYPDSICEVIYQESQFSWTTKKDVTPTEEESWKFAQILAEDLINGDIEYFANGATHFINPDKVSRMPNWTKEFEMIGRMGDHVFYADGSATLPVYLATLMRNIYESIG